MHKTAVQMFNNFATEYQEKFMDVSMYHDSLNLFCSLIKNEKADILDIACGPGNITKYVLGKRPDFKMLGIDLSINMIELATINNPQAIFKIMDSRDIKKIDKKFDGILCGFCLPYLSKKEALKLISDTSFLLNPNGIFYLSTMEDDYSKSGFKAPSSGGPAEMYIHYHQADYLIEALIGNDFTILDISRKDIPGQEESTEKDLIIVSKKS